MKHLATLEAHHEDSAWVRATGRYYTPEVIGRPMVRSAIGLLPQQDAIHVVDPFCGDGRLIVWLLEEAAKVGMRARWHVSLWDLDGEAVRLAALAITETADRLSASVSVETSVGDSFTDALDRFLEFDLVVTNPPWERLKPDRRELTHLSDEGQRRYVAELRSYDTELGTLYPISPPRRKFSGWGTNLARVGTELAASLTRPGGVIAIVSPPSLMADEDSLPLRRYLLTQFDMRELSHFPAEGRFFDGMDQPALTLVGTKTQSASSRITVIGHDHLGARVSEVEMSINSQSLAEVAYRLPTGFGLEAVDLLAQLEDNLTFGDLEAGPRQGLWAGRELDETRIGRKLTIDAAHPFIKGRMVTRWGVPLTPSMGIDDDSRVPESVFHQRVAWRDVSRPTQKRRVQAAVIPKGWIAGNSLSVAYFRDDNVHRLLSLLAIINSLPFEFQIRARLSTAHISLSAVRRVGVPRLDSAEVVDRLAALASQRLRGELDAEYDLEVEVARLYGLDAAAHERLVRSFPKMSEAESEAMAARWRLSSSRVR